MCGGVGIAVSTNPWTYAAPPWINNKQFTLRAKGIDLALNDSGFGLYHNPSVDGLLNIGSCKFGRSVRRPIAG